MDNWSWLNELMQNIIAVAVIGVWLLLEVLASTEGIEVSEWLRGAALAVLFYYGYRVIKGDGTSG